MMKYLFFLVQIKALSANICGNINAGNTHYAAQNRRILGFNKSAFMVFYFCKKLLERFGGASAPYCVINAVALQDFGKFIWRLRCNYVVIASIECRLNFLVGHV